MRGKLSLRFFLGNISVACLIFHWCPKICARRGKSCGSDEFFCQCSRFNDIDVNALLEFKAQVYSEITRNLSDWGSKSDCSNGWTGICCDKTGRVNAIFVPGIQLRGQITSSLGNLTELQELTLSSNLLFGEIPLSLGYLPNLKSLRLFSNDLTGPIPYSLGNLSMLKVLDLSGNKLGDTIPISLNSLLKLETLNLSFNELSGSIPPFVNLLNLTLLSLSSNNLSGYIPSNLSSITQLQSIHLGSNQLTGSIPSSFGKLNNLQELDLSHDSLTGAIPDSFRNLTHLQRLILTSNQITGSIPPYLGSFPNLKNLELGSNSFSGAIPSTLAKLSNLQSLLLSGNQLDSPIPPALASLHNLRFLDLSNNNLKGLPFPYPKIKFPSLTALDLSSNDFEMGNLPAEIGNMANIESLQCRGCNLIGSIPIAIRMLTKLQQLDLTSNAFSGTLNPTIFENFTEITSILIAGSSLTGSIPSLQGLSALSNLDLSSNSFTSQIPSFLPTSLVSLNLKGNSLHGVLTNSSFSSLTKLDILHLDNNVDITGSIPILNVSILSLTHTSISGPIPAIYLTQNETLIYLFGTPACKTANLNTTSMCSAPSPANIYIAPNVCTPLQPCFSTNLPNPYVLEMNGSCVCSGYVNSTLTLAQSPFTALTTVSAVHLEQGLGSKAGLPFSSVWVQTAVTEENGKISVKLYVFGDSLSVSDAVVYSFLSIWSSSPVSISGVGSVSSSPLDSYPFVETPLSPGQRSSSSLSSSAKLPVWAVIIVSMAASVLFLSLICLLILICKRERHKAETEFEGIIPQKSHYVPRIPLSDVLEATDCFSKDRKIGSGGFGDVYFGRSPDRAEWAVKRARGAMDKSLPIFQKEVDIMSNVSHQNVVKLLGYCDTKSEQILVYEYMNAGTLKARLSSSSKDPSHELLSFAECVEVALGAAEGLMYLHDYLEPPIIHRDIKSENILLNRSTKGGASGLQAKISDFGALRQMEGAVESMATAVAGTNGYIDPEYFTSYRATKKSDVYSFGVVLLELITGLPALILEDSGEGEDSQNLTSLPNWVQPFMGDLERMASPRFKQEYNVEAMELMVKLAKSCTERSGKYRPSMKEVCIRLHRARNLVLGVADETKGTQGDLRDCSRSRSVPWDFSFSRTESERAPFLGTTVELSFS